MTWRNLADWAKRRPAVLRAADRLGRTRGRLRILDRLAPPPPPSPVRPDLSNWDRHRLAAAWIGHATVLLRVGGMTVLTDPVFSDRIGLGLGVMTLGPRRRFAPAIALRDLPPVDLILVSHAHFDHLDRPTLVRLPKSIPVLTSAHNGDLVRDLGFRKVRELRLPRDPTLLSGERVRIGGMTITARRVPHWAPRTFHDTHRGYCAFLLEAGDCRVVFGGDSAGGDHFADLGGVDLAILGIGGYDPYLPAHATPEQAWRMFRQMGGRALLPIHHDTFRLSHEPIDEPLRRLLACAEGEAERIVIRRIGQSWIDPTGQGG
jgi:L-ascorbate metabolism protein UlaG (beta-lactamase superfamily)